ncbi:substrate-binding domain-containing protein [Streptantibioticus parmotrematis]|uniref:caspase, EACC1-associated type n=1 Tax=Streptantibioticus parmotrematis TaxID=2873249 RepID=UPI0033F1DDA0
MAYEPFASRSRAVLIGVPEYEHAEDFCNLPSVRANVDRLYEVLTDRTLGRMIPAAVEVLREPRTHDNALRLVRAGVARAQDLLLVYFAGHGYLDLSGGEPELYLMTRESSKGGAQLNGIRYSALLEQLGRSRAERVVLVLDCCFSGSAARVPLPDRPFSLITSSRPLSLIHKGDGIAPTPFTAALVRALSEGTSPYDSVTVMSLGRRLTELAEADAAAMDPDVGYDAWWPREFSSGGGGDTVLSVARRSDGEPRRRRLAARAAQWPRRLAGYAGFAVTWSAGPGQPWWHRMCGALLGVALVAGGGVGYVAATRPAPLCPTPLELRVLTSPEAADAMTSVLDGFQDSPYATRSLGGRPAGCGQIHVTVELAPGDEAVEAFSRSASWAEPQLAPDCTASGAPSGASSIASSSAASSSASSSGASSGAAPGSSCFEPLRDVGAHPDVWLPASVTDYQRVVAATERPASAVTLGLPRTVARSPAVLAVPGTLGAGVPVTGSPIARLVAAARAQHLDVRHADPRSSAAALAEALGLTPAQDAEKGVPEPDDATLLCDERAARSTDPGSRQALMVSEQSVAALVDPTLDSRPPCLGQDSDAYVAYYPKDVPELDLSFVPVTWRDAHLDSAARAEAVRRLDAWLESPDGQRRLEDEGFRAVARGAAPPAGSPLDSIAFRRDPGPSAPQPTAGRVAQVLSAYGSGASGTGTGAGGRREVLFVVDVSTSAYTGGEVDAVDAVLRSAVGALGRGDTYGIAAVPGSLGPDAAPLTMGTHTAAQLSAAMGRLTAINANAPIDQAVSAWSARLARDHAGSPLLVLVTDDEDSRGSPPASDVPVMVVSTQDGGCRLAFNARLTSPYGACVDGSQDLAPKAAEALERLTGGGG